MRKKYIIFLGILVCLTLVSDGFAAWVFTSDINTTTKGSISIDIVTDNRVSVKAEIVDDEKIFFGSKKKDSSTKYDWLKQLEKDDLENLDAFLQITISGYSFLEKEETLKISMKTSDSDYKALQEARLVGALPFETETIYSKKDLESLAGSVQGENFEYDAASNTAVITILIKFEWGKYFNNQNPIDYYNSFEYSDRLAADADEKINTYLKALNDDTYTLTIITNTES